MIIIIIVVVVCGRYCCTSRLNHLIFLAYACKNILLILPIIETVITSRETHTQYASYRFQEEKNELGWQLTKNKKIKKDLEQRERANKVTIMSFVVTEWMIALWISRSIWNGRKNLF